MSDKFDAVIIGSGIGGLTCAALLARSGMRVCVCEQHSRIGGYTHSFTRGSFVFEPAVHAVSVGNQGFIRFLLGILGKENALKTIEHPFMYSLTTHHGSFYMPSGMRNIVPALNDSFPQERGNLRRMLTDMRELYHALAVPFFSAEIRPVQRDLACLARYGTRSFKEYVDSYIDDERLREIFYAQWIFSGSSPETAPALSAAMAFYVHALEGVHYIQGGSQQLAQVLRDYIVEQGGSVKTACRVRSLCAEQKSVRAVMLDSGEAVEADWFVSNISPYLLYGRLIAPASQSARMRRRLDNLQPSVSAVAVYLGLRGPVETLGNRTIHLQTSCTSQLEVCRRMVSGNTAVADNVLLLRPPQKAGNPVAMLMTFLPGTQHGDWHAVKDRYVEQLLEQGERMAPGLREQIAWCEGATPQTFERYTGNTAGALYGFVSDRDRYCSARMPATTHLSNLFQTGHYTIPGGGVYNVMESAVHTAGLILTKEQVQPVVRE